MAGPPPSKESQGLDALLPVAARATRAGVFLDIDGVLAPIMPRPEQAFIPEGIKALVADLTGRYCLVATVSGRSAADALGMVGLPEVIVVGNHGLEIVTRGVKEVLGSAELLERVRRAVSQLQGDVALQASGVRLEDKGGSVALHTRGAKDETRAWEVAVAAAQEAATAHRLALLPGRAVIDLRPPGITKGSAVRALVERESLEAAVYVGDDRTDVDAFRTLRALRGEGMVTVSVAVASPEAPEELTETADIAIELSEVRPLLELLLHGAPPEALQETEAQVDERPAEGRGGEEDHAGGS